MKFGIWGASTVLSKFGSFSSRNLISSGCSELFWSSLFSFHLVIIAVTFGSRKKKVVWVPQYENPI